MFLKNLLSQLGFIIIRIEEDLIHCFCKQNTFQRAISKFSQPLFLIFIQGWTNL